MGEVSPSGQVNFKKQARAELSQAQLIKTDDIYAVPDQNLIKLYVMDYDYYKNSFNHTYWNKTLTIMMMFS